VTSYVLLAKNNALNEKVVTTICYI